MYFCSPFRRIFYCASEWISYWPSICAFTAHPGENITVCLGEFLTVLLCGLLQPIQLNILLLIWVNFFPDLHLCFYNPSRWTSYCDLGVSYCPFMSIFLAHPGEYLNCASGWISYQPSICAFIVHPGEIITVHLGEFLTDLLCGLLLPIILHIWVNFWPAFHGYFYSPSRWIS